MRASLNSLLLLENHPIDGTRVAVRLAFEFDRNPQTSASERKWSLIGIADRRTTILSAIEPGRGAMGRPSARNVYGACSCPIDSEARPPRMRRDALERQLDRSL